MTTTKPSKQAVHDWFLQRQAEKSPPPSPAEVRRALGWGLIRDMDPLGKSCPR